MFTFKVPIADASFTGTCQISCLWKKLGSKGKHPVYGFRFRMGPGKFLENENLKSRSGKPGKSLENENLKSRSGKPGKWV